MFEEIKRWKRVTDPGYADQMCVRSDGHWVRHTDHAARIAELQAERDRYRARAYELASAEGAVLDRVAELQAEVDEWKHRAQQSAEAVTLIRGGKPLGEIVGMHMIHNMSVEQARLQTENARLQKGCEFAMNEIRDYMAETGGALPLELAMGWLKAALEVKP